MKRKVYGPKVPEFTNWQGETVYRQTFSVLDGNDRVIRTGERLVSDSGNVERHSPFKKPIRYSDAGIV